MAAGGAAAAGLHPIMVSWYRGGWGSTARSGAGSGRVHSPCFGLSSRHVMAAMAMDTRAWEFITFSPVGREQFQRLGAGLGRQQLGFTADTPTPITRGGRGTAGPTTIIYDYSQPINVDARRPTRPSPRAPSRSFRPPETHSRPVTIHAPRNHRPGLETDARSRSRAQISCSLPLCPQRYDEAAAVAYTVLTAGPGWNWTTLVGLYPDVDTYTNQLRAVEAL